MKLVFGSDHAGFELKEALKKAVEGRGYQIIDHGSATNDPMDYPDVLSPVVQDVLAGAIGVLICGSGIGMSIGANRFKGIRGVLCTDLTLAISSRQVNDANVLILGSRFISYDTALACLEAFLSTPFSGDERHRRRVGKLDMLG